GGATAFLDELEGYKGNTQLTRGFVYVSTQLLKKSKKRFKYFRIIAEISKGKSLKEQQAIWELYTNDSIFVTIHETTLHFFRCLTLLLWPLLTDKQYTKEE